MVSRATTSWLSLLGISVLLACALDFAVFSWRQRHGDVLSFTTVKQYTAIPEAPGHWHIAYFGTVDIPCVQALLPHQRRAPCWWVSLHHDHWE